MEREKSLHLKLIHRELMQKEDERLSLVSGDELKGRVRAGYTAILEKPLSSKDLIAACYLFTKSY